MKHRNKYRWGSSNWCNLDSHDASGARTFVKNKTHMWHDRAEDGLVGGVCP